VSSSFHFAIEEEQVGAKEGGIGFAEVEADALLLGSGAGRIHPGCVGCCRCDSLPFSGPRRRTYALLWLIGRLEGGGGF